MRHVVGDRSICFVAFNKDIAKVLKQRAPRGVDVSTLHSLGLRAAKVLRPSNVRPDEWVDGDKAKAIARRIVGVEQDRTRTERSVHASSRRSRGRTATIECCGCSGPM